MRKYLQRIYDKKEEKNIDSYKDVFEKYIKEQYNCDYKEYLERLSKYNVAIIISVSHFLKYYEEEFADLNKSYSQLSMFRIVALQSAIETVIGFPVNDYSRRTEACIYKFFNDNLSVDEKNKIINSVKFFKDEQEIRKNNLYLFVKFILESRNGFVHRAQLFYFDVGTDIVFSNRYHKGKKIGEVSCALNYYDYSSIVKKAILRYLLNKKRNLQQSMVLRKNKKKKK